jgi:hypothetical protein
MLVQYDEGRGGLEGLWADRWLRNFRWLTVRHDRLLDTYRDWFIYAYAIITLRRILK